jgi:hypothetical protein
MRYGRNQYVAIIVKANEATIEEMIGIRRQKQAVLAVEALVVR